MSGFDELGMDRRIRRLSYLSESVSTSDDGVPSDLASIVIKSRRYNHANQITGFLTIREGYFFQTIEGPGSAVEELFRKISGDGRHVRVRTIWDDVGLTERMFSGWKLKLSHSSVSCEEVNHFLRCNQERYENLDADSRELLGKIFQVDLIFSSEDGGGIPPRHRLEFYDFRLQALPLQTAFGHQQIVNIEIFSTLLNDWCSCDELGRRFGMSEDEVYRLLSSKRVKPLLLTRFTPQGERSNRKSVNNDEPSAVTHRSFYQGLRSFFMASRG